jgi:LacI family transcriptional regulator, xylobiose transport system transcriptional regulator
MSEKRVKVRLADIAKQAGVSVSTVSMVMTDHPAIGLATKSKVLRLGERMGYSPGRKTAQTEPRVSERTKRFGYSLIGSELWDETAAPFIRELSALANNQEFRFEVCAISGSRDNFELETRLVKFVQGLDGVILEGFVDKSLLLRIEEQHVPYIVIGGIHSSLKEPPHQIGNYVSHNTCEMGLFATRWLLESGHKRVAFVCEQIIPGLYNYLWLQGYRLAHFDAGIMPDPNLTHIVGNAFAGGQQAADVFATMSDRPDAFVVPDTRVGMSFIAAMKRHNIEIPLNAIVLGGIPSLAKTYGAELYPMLCEDPVNMAKVALDQLLNIHRKPGFPTTITMIPFKVYNFPEKIIQGSKGLLQND